MSIVHVSPEPPPAADNPSVWRGAELERHGDWIHHVSANEVAELERSVDRTITRALCVPDFGKDDFPLPRFAGVLDRIRENVVNGPGVHVVRGLPVDRWSREQCAIA